MAKQRANRRGGTLTSPASCSGLHQSSVRKVVPEMKKSSDPLGLGTMVGPLSVAQLLRLGVICMAVWSAYTIRL
jgi:hypothetical protein